MEYAQALEVCVRKDLWVQIPPSANLGGCRKAWGVSPFCLRARGRGATKRNPPLADKSPRGHAILLPE